jgi:hypothetical protein
MQSTRFGRRAAAVCLGGLLTALLAAPHALATPQATTMYTDSANDATTVGGVPVADPRIDILDGSMAEDASTLTAVMHVADLDAAVNNTPPGAEEGLRYETSVENSAHTWVIFQAASDPIKGERASFAVSATAPNPQSPDCSGPATAVFDPVADTVAVTVVVADINACPAFAGSPLVKGAVLSDPFAYAAVSATYGAGISTFDTDKDSAQGTGVYTMQH